MSTVHETAPAKLNLFLAVTGRRPDGYHDLVSLAAPLAWGDELAASPRPEGEFTLGCDDPAVPTGEDNLVLKAARAFARAGGRGGAAFELRKRIPMTAGLGGGSSDAAAALRALAALDGRAPGSLEEIAAGVGSDCPFFVGGTAAVMRGRGERLEAVPPAARTRLAGRRVLVFKPGFGVSTPWAYGRLAESRAYLRPEEAEERLRAWLEDPGAAPESLLYNSFEAPVFSKFPAIPLVFERLRRRFELKPALSGSGSACFAFLPTTGGPSAEEAGGEVRAAWGASALVVETRLN